MVETLLNHVINRFEHGSLGSGFFQYFLIADRGAPMDRLGFVLRNPYRGVQPETDSRFSDNAALPITVFN